MDRQQVLMLPPEPIREVRELEISRPDESRLRLRAYRPGPHEADLVVLFIHGGAWIVGSLDSHDRLCRAIANRTDALVVAVDYRLAPDDPFPAGLEDCLLASRWIEGNLAKLGADSAAVAFAGDSAGGNLAAALCLRRMDEGLPQPIGQVLVYPALDPTCSSESHREMGWDYFTTSESLNWAWLNYVGDADSMASPLVAPVRASSLAGLAPALIITAQFDPLRDEAELYWSMLRRDGVPATTVRYGGMIHGFLSCDRHMSAAQTAKDQVASWLRAQRNA